MAPHEKQARESKTQKRQRRCFRNCCPFVGKGGCQWPHHPTAANPTRAAASTNAATSDSPHPSAATNARRKASIETRVIP